jgi:hypothetical protein
VNACQSILLDRQQQSLREPSGRRKKVEAVLAKRENQIGLRRLRLERMKFVREQFFLAATAQNIERLIRSLSQLTNPLVLTPTYVQSTRKSTRPTASIAKLNLKPLTFFNTQATGE